MSRYPDRVSRFLDDMGEGAVDDLLSISDAGLRGQFVRALGRVGSGSALSSRYLVRNALDAYTQLSQGAKRLVQRTFRSSNDGSIRLLNIEVCGASSFGVASAGAVASASSSCLPDDLIESMKTFGDDVGLRDDAIGDLKNSFEEFTEISDDIPGKNPDDVLEDLRFLADEGRFEDDFLTGLDETIKAVDGQLQHYLGLAGEARTARRVIDGGADPDSVEMRKVVDRDAIEEKKLPDDINPDKDLLDGDSDIDVNVENRKAYESKNAEFPPLEPGEGPPSPIPSQRAGDQLNRLRQKLNTWAASGQDEIVVAVRREELGIEYSDLDIDRTHFPGPVKDVDSLDDLASLVESNFNDVDVTFKTYEEVG